MSLNICANTHKKLTKIKLVKLNSVQTLLKMVCLPCMKSYMVMVQTLFRNTSFAHRKSYLVIICANVCEKLTKSKMVLKLKSVQALIRITCLARMKSDMVIICTNSCEQFTKWVKLNSVCNSNIAHRKDHFMTYCMCFIETLVITSEDTVH